MKPPREIHPTPFTGTAADNILTWLENFDCIAAHKVCNDQKQLQVIPVYLKDLELLLLIIRPNKNWHHPFEDCFTRSLPQAGPYDMCVKLHELRQISSLETYINNLNALARHLELPEQ